MKRERLLYGLILGSQTDERLCALVGAGEERAFAVLADRHRAELIRAAVRAGAQDNAEDAVQDALLSAWKAMRGGVRVRHPRAWLHQIVRHAVITQARRQPGAEPLEEELAGGEVVDEQLANRDLAREVLAEIASLPERQREALIATEFGRRSRREIAAELGVSEGAVRQLVYRARDSVRMAFSAVMPLPLLAWLLRPRLGPAERLTRALIRANGSSFTQTLLSQRGASNLLRGGAVLLAAGAAGTLALPHLVGHNPLASGVARPLASPGLTTSPDGVPASSLSGGGLGLPSARGAVGGAGSLALLAGAEPELAMHELEDSGVTVPGSDLLESAARRAGLGDSAERAVTGRGGARGPGSADGGATATDSLRSADGSQSAPSAGSDSATGARSSPTAALNQAGAMVGSTDSSTLTSAGTSGRVNSSAVGSGSTGGVGESSGQSGGSATDTASKGSADGGSSTDSSSKSTVGRTGLSDS